MENFALLKNFEVSPLNKKSSIKSATIFENIKINVKPKKPKHQSSVKRPKRNSLTKKNNYVNSNARDQYYYTD